MKTSHSPIALVTGAAKGVGATIAEQLARDGYTVVVHYHSSTADAERTLKAIRTHQPASSMIAADIRSQKERKQLVNLVLKRYGRIDVLVNTVGNFIFTPLAQTSVDVWRDVLETNLEATMFLSQLVLPQMRKQKYGRIVNFGAVSADRMIARPRTTPYYIAKTGVIILTKQLAEDNAKYGITVNAISPGILESSVVKLKTPTGKYIRFNDIARTVSFVVQPESQAINGANIEVAGGFKFV